MPTIQTSAGPATFCVLIPSRGRPEQLAKSLKRMPWLIDDDTLLGLELKEIADYRTHVWAVSRGRLRAIKYDNPEGSVAAAREQLRRYAMAAERYTHFVVTDDNAVHRSQEALHNLVRACAEWKTPCIMAGMHNTASHFDRGKIPTAVVRCGLRSYANVAAIFQCYPRAIYERYRYPTDAYGLDDRHFFLWCLSKGHTEFRVCMDAPFTKSRYQDGGQGPLEQRAEKCGRAIARLATDFPSFVGSVGTLRIPWQHVITTVKSGGTITGTRLVGGAMRKEEKIQKSIRVRVRRK